MNEEMNTLITEYIDEWTMTDLKDDMKATDEELIYFARLMQHQRQKTKRSWRETDYGSPSVVIDDFLYHGDINHAKNIDLLRKLGIKHILNSCNEPLGAEIDENFNVLWINIMDAFNVNINGHIQKANDFLLSCKEKGEKVLVHCHMGISRSSSIVLAYLMKYHHDSLMKAYDYLLDRRSICSPNSGFLMQLIRYEQTLRTGGVIDEQKNNDDKENPIKPVDIS